MSDPAIVWERHDRVLLITLNRPRQLNSLNRETVRELNALLVPADKDPDLGCVVITGNEKAFAAGADIKQMQDKSYQAMARDDHFAEWETFAKLRTPRIAAVNGYALGGGCELMLMCDFAIAGRSAKFGLPEIKLGVMPGMGGTQRLPRLVGRALAMDLILTGRTMDAAEALAAGLVARLVDDDTVVDTALQAAATIASHSKPATVLARDAVNRADEISLSEGALFERRVFHSLFATNDQREGMSAFIDKRPPVFTGT